MAVSLELAMLAELIDATPPTLKEMSVGFQRHYNRSGVEKHRDAVQAALDVGIVLPTKPHIRAALADAAMAILASDGPGADEVRRVLRSVFHAHAGTPMTVEAHIHSGKIKPTFHKSR